MKIILAAVLAFTGLFLAPSAAASEPPTPGCVINVVYNTGLSDAPLWVVDNDSGGAVTVYPGGNTPGGFSSTHFAIGPNHQALVRRTVYSGSTVVGQTGWIGSGGGATTYWYPTNKCGWPNATRVVYEVLLDNLAI